MILYVMQCDSCKSFLIDEDGLITDYQRQPLIWAAEGRKWKKKGDKYLCRECSRIVAINSLVPSAPLRNAIRETAAPTPTDGAAEPITPPKGQGSLSHE
jgi:hypothetical protein